MPFVNITSPKLPYLEEVLRKGRFSLTLAPTSAFTRSLRAGLVGATGKVIALEPTAQSFETLRQNIALNHFSNVRAFQVA